MSDPRKKRGIRHQIAPTLAMVAAAGLSGSGRSFRSAGDFVADLPQEALARLGARFHPVRRCYIAPDEATIRRHVQMTGADQADAVVGAWLLAQVRAGRLAAGQAASRTMVALDGKVLKGAWEELPDVKVKLFSALVHGEGVIIGQRKVPEDTTEVTQVLPLTGDIAAARPPAAGGAAGGDGDGDLAGLVLTADAPHVHRDNLQQVAGRGGEHIVTVKGNQPSLERDIAALFPEGPASGDFPPHHVTFDRGRGRSEIRSIWASPHVAGLDADILAGNRGHWQVENREHYVRDKTFDEDRSQVRTGSSPQFPATARNIAISLLRLAGCVNIARGLEHLSRRLDCVLALLGVLPKRPRKEVMRTPGLCR